MQTQQTSTERLWYLDMSVKNSSKIQAPFLDVYVITIYFFFQKNHTKRKV